MARIAVVRSVAILDTSWLLELYQVPGYFESSRTLRVRQDTADIGKAGYELFVTVPVLFEVASHITHVRNNGNRRRALGEKLRQDITRYLRRASPWTIAGVDRAVLLRSEDLIRLASRFPQESGPNYSFADISIIDLAAELRRPGRKVSILTLNKRLLSYSD